MTQLTPSGHMPLEAHEAHLRNWSEMYAMEVLDDDREPQEQQPLDRESHGHEAETPRIVKWFAWIATAVAILACAWIATNEPPEQPTTCVVQLKGLA